jgi:transcriptional regulator with GAF, ATPase, and Fis domain
MGALERTERQLERQQKTNLILSRLVLGSKLDEVIGEILATIAELTKASRVRVFVLSADKTLLEDQYEWTGAGAIKLKDTWKTMPVNAMPWFMRRMWSSEVVVVKDVNNLPTEADVEKETLRRQNIKSILAVPLPVGHTLGGFIEIDEVEDVDEWNNNENLNILTVVAEGIGQKLGSNKNTPMLEHSQEWYRSIFESVDEGIIVLAKNGLVEDVNKRMLEMVEKDEDFFHGKRLRDISTRMHEYYRQEPGVKKNGAGNIRL